MPEIPPVINYKGSDRRKFHIDWSLNVTSLIALIGILIAIIKFGSDGVQYLKIMNARTTIMWNHFDKGQLSKEELIRLESSY